MPSMNENIEKIADVSRRLFVCANDKGGQGMALWWVVLGRLIDELNLVWAGEPPPGPYDAGEYDAAKYYEARNESTNRDEFPGLLAWRLGQAGFDEKQIAMIQEITDGVCPQCDK